MIARAESQLPPSDRAEQPDEPNAPVVVGKSKPGAEIDQALRARIKARLGENLTQSELARQIRVSVSTINRWINDVPAGDVGHLEWLLEKWEKDIDERIDLSRINVPTALTGRVAGVLTSVARTSDFALMTGRAGIGKTCGIQLYVVENPTAIVLTASQLHGNAEAMVRDLWRESGTQKRKTERALSKNDILVARYKDSNILIIIDDAHELTASGLKWAKGFHNRTGCPIVLSGNPSMLDKIRMMPDEDQFTSRIGQNRKLVLTPDDEKELAALMLRQFAPRHQDELNVLAIQVCGKRGFARKLKKQLRLALEILDGGIKHDNDAIKALAEKGYTDAQIAFKLAAGQLLTVEDE